MTFDLASGLLVGKDAPIPTPFLKAFRDDVVHVALSRDAGVILAHVAKDFGIDVGTLDTWMRQALTASGEQPDVTKSENDELEALRKRNRLLEQARKRSPASCCGVSIASESAGKRSTRS